MTQGKNNFLLGCKKQDKNFKVLEKVVTKAILKYDSVSVMDRRVKYFCRITASA